MKFTRHNNPKFSEYLLKKTAKMQTGMMPIHKFIYFY